MTISASDDRFDRMTDLTLAHLLLDDESHPLYEANLDHVLDAACVGLTSVADAMHKTLEPLLHRLDSHQHLNTEQLPVVHDALTSAWSSKVLAHIIDTMVPCRSLYIRRDVKEHRIELKIRQLSELGQTALPGNLTPAGGSDSAVEMRQGRSCEPHFQDGPIRDRPPQDSSNGNGPNTTQTAGAAPVKDSANVRPSTTDRHPVEDNYSDARECIQASRKSQQAKSQDSRAKTRPAVQGAANHGRSAGDRPTPETAAVTKKWSRATKGVSRAQTEYRRPVATGTYYSNKCTEEAWAQADTKRKRELSHIGRLEETDAAREATESCERCMNKNLCCKVYTDKGRDIYHVKNVGYGSSQCRFSGASCSKQTNHDRSHPRAKRKTIADAEREIAALRAAMPVSDGVLSPSSWMEGRSLSSMAVKSTRPGAGV